MEIASEMQAAEIELRTLLGGNDAASRIVEVYIRRNDLAKEALVAVLASRVATVARRATGFSESSSNG
jgi:hypothetical protein